MPDHILRISAEVKRKAVDWAPGMKYERQLCLKAASWQAWADAAVPEAAGLRPHLAGEHPFATIPVGRPVTALAAGVGLGKFVLHRLTLPHLHYATEVVFFLPRTYWKVEALPLLRYGRRHGYVYFDGDVHIPVLAGTDLRPWMSATPSEAMGQRAGIRAARGRVLVAGLGMGYLAKEIRRKQGVTRVTVVEQDPDIAAFFGPGFLAAPGCPADPIRVDDFYATDLAGFDSVVADIWRSCNDAGWDDRFQRLKKDLTARGVKVWGWGDYVPRE